MLAQSQGHASSPTTAGAGCGTIRSGASTPSSRTRPGTSAPTSPTCCRPNSSTWCEATSTRAASSSTTRPTPPASSAPAASLSPHGARFTNHMVVSPIPIAWDFARWRRTLEVLSHRRPRRCSIAPRSEDRAVLDRLMAMEGEPHVRRASRRAGRSSPAPTSSPAPPASRPVTDDNMGSEWRYFLGLD